MKRSIFITLAIIFVVGIWAQEIMARGFGGGGGGRGGGGGYRGRRSLQEPVHEPASISQGLDLPT